MYGWPISTVDKYIPISRQPKCSSSHISPSWKKRLDLCEKNIDYEFRELAHHSFWPVRAANTSVRMYVYIWTCSGIRRSKSPNRKCCHTFLDCYRSISALLWLHEDRCSTSACRQRSLPCVKLGPLRMPRELSVRQPQKKINYIVLYILFTYLVQIFHEIQGRFMYSYSIQTTVYVVSQCTLFFLLRRWLMCCCLLQVTLNAYRPGLSLSPSKRYVDFTHDKPQQ